MLIRIRHFRVVDLDRAAIGIAVRIGQQRGSDVGRNSVGIRRRSTPVAHPDEVGRVRREGSGLKASVAALVLAVIVLKSVPVKSLAVEASTSYPVGDPLAAPQAAVSVVLETTVIVGVETLSSVPIDANVAGELWLLYSVLIQSEFRAILEMRTSSIRPSNG